MNHELRFSVQDTRFRFPVHISRHMPFTQSHTRTNLQLYIYLGPDLLINTYMHIYIHYVRAK